MPPLNRGDVVLVNDFVFPDGSSKDKFLVILTSTEKFLDVVFVPTTSKVQKYVPVLKSDSYIVVPANTGPFCLETLIRCDSVQRVERSYFDGLQKNGKPPLPEPYISDFIAKVLISDKVSAQTKRLIR